MPKMYLTLRYCMGGYDEEDLPENWDDTEWWNEIFFQSDIMVGDMDIVGVDKQ